MNVSYSFSIQFKEWWDISDDAGPTTRPRDGNDSVAMPSLKLLVVQNEKLTCFSSNY